MGTRDKAIDNTKLHNDSGDKGKKSKYIQIQQWKVEKGRI